MIDATVARGTLLPESDVTREGRSTHFSGERDRRRKGGEMPQLTFVLNGREMRAEYEEGMTFLEVLRDVCGVTSPKDGCAPQGYCGCCAILLEGRAVLSCLRKPESVKGKSVTTLEGIPEEQRRLVAEAFVREGGLQCGYCTPGLAVRTCSLLDHQGTDDR